MTMREVVSAVVSIRKRKNLDICIQSALLGRPIKPEDLGIREEKPVEFTKEDDAAAERLMQEAIKRKQAEYARTNG
jgi:hypothetical protein